MELCCLVDRSPSDSYLTSEHFILLIVTKLVLGVWISQRKYYLPSFQAFVLFKSNLQQPLKDVQPRGDFCEFVSNVLVVYQ